MKNLILLTLIFSTFGAVAYGQSCRDAYVQVRNRIFTDETSTNTKLGAAAAGTLGGIVGTIAVHITTAVPGEAASTGALAAGPLTTFAPTVIPITAKYYDWTSNDMDGVLALLEESRVGFGYHIKKSAIANSVSEDVIIKIMTAVDGSNELCGSGLLMTKTGLNSIIAAKLKSNSLNTGTLK